MIKFRVHLFEYVFDLLLLSLALLQLIFVVTDLELHNIDVFDKFLYLGLQVLNVIVLGSQLGIQLLTSESRFLDATADIFDPIVDFILLGVVVKFIIFISQMNLLFFLDLNQVFLLDTLCFFCQFLINRLLIPHFLEYAV